MLANIFLTFIHQQEDHGVFASWDIYKCDTRGGAECVFRGLECSRPGLQEGSNALEEPSRFYCVFMSMSKSFNHLVFFLGLCFMLHGRIDTAKV